MAAASATIHLTPIVDRIDGECPACGFDALVYIRAYHITDRGVGLVAERIECGRCASDERRGRGHL